MVCSFFLPENLFYLIIQNILFIVITGKMRNMYMHASIKTFKWSDLDFLDLLGLYMK